MRILGVRGIYDEQDGAKSFVGKLLDGLADSEHEIAEVDYPFMTALGAYSGYYLQAAVNSIVQAHQPGDALIAHSFGGWASIRAMQQGASFSVGFLFAPAAPAEFELPPQACKRLYVIRSDDDRALKIGAKLPSHIFGPLGLTGYEGFDPRIVNVPAVGYDHSDHVRPENIQRWLNWMSIAMKAV